MYSNGKIHCAYQIIDFFYFPPIGSSTCHQTNRQEGEAVATPRLREIGYGAVGGVGGRARKNFDAGEEVVVATIAANQHLP